MNVQSQNRNFGIKSKYLKNWEPFKWKEKLWDIIQERNEFVWDQYRNYPGQ